MSITRRDGLKAVIAANATNEKLEVQFISSEERPDVHQQGKLPVLEHSEGNFIVSPNAATRYILQKKGQDFEDTEVDQLLDWEAGTLQPLVHAVLASKLGSNKVDDALLTDLDQALATLNTKLVKKYFLVAKRLTAADVAIWSTLYPICSKLSPCPEIKNKHDAVCTYYGKLLEVPPFVNATKTIFPDASQEGLKKSILTQPAPLLPPKLTKLAISKQAKSKMAATGKPSTPPTAECDAPSRPPVTDTELAEASRLWSQGPKAKPLPRERKYPILPKEGEKNYLITSALPYVNNVPHLGNIIGCVLSADVYSRYCRLRGYNSLYICGTDEYGTATETKAVEEGLTPQQICDKYHAIHADVYQWFNIDFDYFGRTTTTQQTEIAQDIFWKLENNGYILKDSVDQLQCEKCNRFLADRFVEGICPLCGYEDARGDQCDKCGKLINAVELIKPRCKLCNSSPVVKTSQHLFMDLPKIEPLLTKYLDREFDIGVWTTNTKQITNSWIRDGLKPRCITRDLQWGTPVPMPGYTDKVFYVWYDAPIGYISITANYTDQWQQWWKNQRQVNMFNFMAKDNVPFHSVIFPCTLLGATDDWTVVRNLSATEYLNYEDGKFSKSRGVGVFGNNARDAGIPADIWRFYLLYVRPEGQDSTFSWDDFMMKNNSELLNNLGNFINRALMFVNNQFGGTVPQLHMTGEDTELVALVNRELTSFIDNLEKIKLRDGIRNILSISRLGNQYMQSNKPWVLVKGSDEEKKRAGTVVGLAANMACLLSALVQPYMPLTSDIIQTQLQAPPSCNVITAGFVPYLPAGHKIGKPSPLFQKLEQKLIDEQKAKYGGPQVKPEGNQAPATLSQADVDQLTEEVTQQGIKVRELKAAKAEKSTIDEQVAILLALKKTLATAKGESAPAAGGKKSKGGESNKQPNKQPVTRPQPTASQEEIDRLTEEVAQQGNKVRELKTSKAEKSTVDEHVAILLSLKQKLATAKGEPLPSAGGKKSKGKKK